MVAPSAAPAELPITYGSASGLRSIPWYSAPVVASAAPARAPATTRGSRIVSRMVSSLGVHTTGPLYRPACRSRISAACRGSIGTAPMAVPARSAPSTSSAVIPRATGARGRHAGVPVAWAWSLCASVCGAAITGAPVSLVALSCTAGMI